MTSWILILTVILGYGPTHQSSSANILAFYPYPAPSHHLVYWPLLRELVNRGHNVTMFSPLTMPDQPANNYTHLKIKDYSQELKELEDTGFKMSSIFFLRFFQNSMFFMDIGKYLTQRVLEEELFQWLLKSDSKFDLIFGEWTFSHETFSALHHRFGAINVELTSFGNFHWTYWLYGQPYDTSYIADSDTCFSDRMSFVERIQNTLQSVVVRTLWLWYYMPEYQQLMNQHMRYPGWESRPEIIDLLRNTSLVLMNTHFSLNYPYPNSPQVKEIGGINIQRQTQKSLPYDMLTFMDEAKDGLIYFSLGSFLQGDSVLDGNIRDIFIEVFKNLKQRVLWKWESPIPNLPSNIKTGSWLPQQSILAHKNCKLFISHAGFLSLTEAVDQEVPVVAIPIWADQLRNARHMTSRGYAVQVDFNNLTKESISWAINEIINNPKYKEKAIEQSRIFRDKPETALETAVFWTEYVIRHNGAHHLKPAIATMPWYQQAMIDVYLTIAIIILIPLFITYRIMKCLVTKFLNQKIKKD